MELLEQEYNRENYLKFLTDKFNFSELIKGISIVNSDVQSFEKLGFITIGREELPVFELHIKPNTKLERNRVGLRNLVAKQIQTEEGAIAVYVDENNQLWRFSFIHIEYKFGDNGIEKIQTASKRFTYLLGKDTKTRTAKQRFELLNKQSTLQDLKDAFAVEPLNKEFYDKLYKWYENAQTQVTFPNDDNAQNHIQTNLIRFLTRILFVWFLKEKQLINKDLFDLEKLNELINYGKDSSFYKAILQNLFFATLNRQIKDRSFRTTTNGKANNTNYLATNIYRYQDYFTNQDNAKIMALFKQTPFLNGGLFECLDREARDSEKEDYDDDKNIRPVKSAIRIDGFSDKNDNELKFDNALLFNDDEQNLGLIDLFNQYQFTVEESTPADIEVALDPELLGKVFENLLATYNPETGGQARKATGSFYTPREIVAYMVDESLKQYFKTHTDLTEIEINSLFIESENTLNKSQIKRVINAIDNLKILDPAVGSGAYPMGVLQRLVFILDRIDPENKAFKQQQLDKTKEMEEASKKASIEAIEQIFSKENQHNTYGKKLMLIESCIYGVDIQPIAIQICKLRFFISLTIEQTADENKENHGIKALPNLETKFIVANTLLPLGKIEASGGMTETIGLFDWNYNITTLQQDLAKTRHQYFTAKTLKTKRKYRKEDQQLRQQMLETSKQPGISPEIEISMQKVVEWDLYNQNATSDWFDPEWMFGVKDGFDIVLGNPPYSQVKRNIYPKINFPFSEGKDKGKQNLYKLFTEQSYNLCKDNGVATMIVQSSLMGDLSSAGTRQLLLNQTQLQHIIEFPETAKDRKKQVFDSVTQGTCIYQFIKQATDNFAINISINNDSESIKKLVFSSIEKQDLQKLYPELLCLPKIAIGGATILHKIANSSSIKPLSEFIQFLEQGDINLTTHSTQFSNELSSVKLMRGRHVERYNIKYEMTDEYIVADFKLDKIQANQDNYFLISQEVHSSTGIRRLHFAIKNNQNEQVLWGHSVNKTLLKNEEENPYFLALLNSKFMDWYFRITSSNNHVQGYEIKKLPIPKISKSEQQPFINLVDKIIKAKQQNQPTTDLEAKIDTMVYQLYKLTADEIKIIESSQ